MKDLQKNKIQSDTAVIPKISVDDFFELRDKLGLPKMTLPSKSVYREQAKKMAFERDKRTKSDLN